MVWLGISKQGSAQSTNSPLGPSAAADDLEGLFTTASATTPQGPQLSPSSQQQGMAGLVGPQLGLGLLGGLPQPGMAGMQPGTHMGYTPGQHQTGSFETMTSLPVAKLHSCCLRQSEDSCSVKCFVDIVPQDFAFRSITDSETQY